MLYAYLLTRTEFKIETEPDVSSADKKFAYSAYIDLLLLLLKLTGQVDGKGTHFVALDKKLQTSSIGKAIGSDLTLKNIIVRGEHNLSAFNDVVQSLHDRIVDTPVYKEYRRKRKYDLEEEVKLWTVLFETTIADNRDLLNVMRALPGFSNVGFEMAVDKVVKTLNSYYVARSGYGQALAMLEHSLLQAHKLYMSMFVLIVRLTEMRETQLENAKSKYLATSQDKNPNTRFIDNAFARALADNVELKAYIKEYGLDWMNDYTFLSSVLDKIMQTTIYKDYMESESSDWASDCEFWRQILRSVVFPGDDLIEMLENTSVYWNDDIHIIGTFVLKSIRIDAQNEDHHIEFLPRYKDDEDSRFGAELFEFAVKNRDQYYAYVEKFVDTANWESDRIAFMDSVIMICAIAEIINFPNIPLAVSFNEYIDIANLYSSAKSGQFINGILYSVVKHLNEQGLIHKSENDGK